MGVGHYRWDCARFDVMAKFKELEARIEKLEKEKASAPEERWPYNDWDWRPGVCSKCGYPPNGGWGCMCET